MAAADEVGVASTNRRRLVTAAGLGGAGVIALLIVLSCYTVGTSEYGLVTEFGKTVKVVATPGLGFKLPYQRIRTFDARLVAFTPASSEFLTVEKTPVVAASTILWRIGDPKRFFQTVFDRTGAESRLGDILFAELGAAIGRSPLSAFASMDPGAYRAEAILAEVTSHCRDTALRDYGIDVVDVQLRSFDFPKQNRPPLYARMRSERGRISMKYRSEGEEEGQKVSAAAEQERAKAIAEATKLAQENRGQGEGQAARIYAQALSKGPEFYLFQRTMDASRNLVPKGTTLVLPADSELFGLLQRSDYYEHGSSIRKVHNRHRKE